MLSIISIYPVTRGTLKLFLLPFQTFVFLFISLIFFFLSLNSGFDLLLLAGEEFTDFIKNLFMTLRMKCNKVINSRTIDMAYRIFIECSIPILCKT